MAVTIGFTLSAFNFDFYDQSMNDDEEAGYHVLYHFLSNLTWSVSGVSQLTQCQIRKWHIYFGAASDSNRIAFDYDNNTSVYFNLTGYNGYPVDDQIGNLIEYHFSSAQLRQIGSYFKNKTSLYVEVKVDKAYYDDGSYWVLADQTKSANRTCSTNSMTEVSYEIKANNIVNPTLLRDQSPTNVSATVTFRNEIGTATFSGSGLSITGTSATYTANQWNSVNVNLSQIIPSRASGKVSWANNSSTKQFEFYTIAPFLRLNGYNELFLYSLENPLVVTSSGATFNNEITAKAVVNTTLYNISNFSINRTITKADAASADGGIYVTHPTASFTFTNDRNVTTTFTGIEGTIKIYVQVKQPKSILITGIDTHKYYENKVGLFKIPSGLTYKFVFNDGTEQAYNSETLHFKLTDSSTGDDLTEDVSEVPANATKIYVHCVLTYDSIDYPIFGFYNIQREVDEILNLILMGVSNITLGNTLKTTDLTIKAVYKSGDEVTLGANDFVITSPTTVLMEAFTSISIRVVGTNNTATFDSTVLSGLTYTVSAPAIGTITQVNLVTGYNNKISALDLRTVKLTIHYANAEYTNEVSLGSTYSSTLYSVVAQIIEEGVASNLFDTESIDNYNGSKFIDIADLENSSANCQFVFTVKSVFDNSTKTLTVPFVVLAMTEIQGIKINNPFTEYRVGDHFLEREDDETEVVVYWEDDSNPPVLHYRALPLNSGYPAISIYPQIGTELKNIENSKQVQVKSVLNSNVSAEYQIKVLPKSIESDSNTLDLVPVWKPSIQCPNGDMIIPENGKGVLILVKRSDVNIGLNNIYELKSEDVKVYGYIKDILDEDRYAITVLFDDYLPPIRSAANAEITFPSYQEGEADLINNCSFGILFGANNSVNRLFVSGNPNIGNADWHTSQLNLTDYEGSELLSINGNFSYFTSAGVMYYGESDNKIVGYDIISDDKLLVLKNKSDKEKTVYFRTPLTLRAVDAAGSVSTDMEGNTETMEEFGLIKGNNSVAGISPYTICNFNGDSLFVDADNQVSGLDLEGTIGNTTRYANSRSKFIDYKLKKLDLSQSTLWNNTKYLFLSVPNIGLFVSHFEAKTDKQYEWWFLTSDNPKVFFDYNNKVYFGNDDGTLGVLDNGIYKDIKKVFADVDQTTLISILPAEERVVLSDDIMAKLSADKQYAFRVIPDSDYKYNIYYEVAQAFATDDPVDVKIDWETDTFVGGSFQENKTYYFNYIEEHLGNTVEIDVNQASIIAEFGRPFRFKQVTIDDEEYIEDKVSYFLIDEESGLRITGFSALEFDEVAICERLDGDVDVGGIDFDRNTLSLEKDGETINIVTYGLQNPMERTIKAEIREYIPIEAFYITSPLFANTLNTFKTIWQITLTNDTDIPSSLKVGVASNKVPFYKSKDIAWSERGDLGINLDDLDFARTDFDKKIVPRTYTMNRVLAMQKFLCLAFKNEPGKNAVLSEMAITYTLPFPSYGSD